MGKRELKRFNKFVDAMFARGCESFDIKDKENNTFISMLYMLNRTQSMFKYENLPDTIPAKILEMFLQINGHVVFYRNTEKNGLFVYRAGLGGEPDVYYRPTEAVIDNPAQRLNKVLKIDEECVVVYNDTFALGLIPLFSKYASLLAENEVSIHVAMINTRIVDILAAPDDRTMESALEFIHHIEDGDLSVMTDNAFLDGIRALPCNAAGSNVLKNLIEIEQYLKAQWFNDIGLNANFNMKREALNSSESALNDDALLPLVENMLKMRQEGIEKVNKMFDTNIKVKLASSWEDNFEEVQLEQESMGKEKEIEDELLVENEEGERDEEKEIN